MDYSDYIEPRFRLKQASVAAAFPLNTLRSYYQRGWFRSFGNGMSVGKGRAQRLCLGDVLVLAIASRLIDLGLRPLDAYNAARPFGLAATTPKGVARRTPFRLFDRREFDSLLVWQKQSAGRVIPVRKRAGISLSDLPLDDPFGEAAVLLRLNAVEATVFEKLGLPLPGRSDAA